MERLAELGELEDLLGELLALSTLTLATCSPGGEPHAAPVYFAASQELRFYFFSDSKSQHTQDIARDSAAAAAFYPLCFDWQDIRGAQMHGQVRLVEAGEEWDRAWELYRRKFPFVAGLEEVIARNLLFVFVPSWLRLLDNRRGFGFKREWELT